MIDTPEEDGPPLAAPEPPGHWEDTVLPDGGLRSVFVPDEPFDEDATDVLPQR